MSQLGIGSSWLPLLSELSESPRQRRKHAVTTCNFLQQWQQRQQHQKQWFGHNYCYLSWLILWKENETTGYKQHETKNKWQKRIERKKKILFYYMLKITYASIFVRHYIKVGTTKQCIPSQERIFVKGRSQCFRLPALIWIVPLTSTLPYLLLFHFVWNYTQISF